MTPEVCRILKRCHALRGDNARIQSERLAARKRHHDPLIVPADRGADRSASFRYHARRADET